MTDFLCIADDVKLGENVKLAKFINLYGCTIGANTKVGAFVEIQKNATSAEIARSPVIPSSAKGSIIEDNVFIGHNVTFINDLYPGQQPLTDACRLKRTGHAASPE